MNLTFTIARKDSLQPVCDLFQDVVANMKRRGLKQWDWGVYPSEAILKQDIAEGVLYLMNQDDRLIGAFVICDTPEEAYAGVAWHFGVKPAILHRLAIRPGLSGQGLAQRALSFVKEEAARLGYDCLRLDTSSQNERAQKLFRGGMTREAGFVYFPKSDLPYPCFESPLAGDCPLLPIRMHPAYRYGDMTPWGGDGLRTLFGKSIPDERTGESMEISAIPTLESRDDAGDPLTKLIARYGHALLGTGEERVPSGDSGEAASDSKVGAFTSAGYGNTPHDDESEWTDKEFPLLLKLIAAREKLSVQVHPGDVYAREHEGKLGKSEAWVILHADEGAEILYGIKQGINKQILKDALDAGEDIEPMLNRVPAKAGDVFFIPSGMVHAIGSGIVLYEIQQSSDVTYRLWDYMRVNEKGETRELHVEKALDVIDFEVLGERGRVPLERAERGAGEVSLEEPDWEPNSAHRILSVPAFTLDYACVSNKLSLAPHSESFRMLTAMATMSLCWEGERMTLAAGESVLLPVRCPTIALEGEGIVLIAAVR